MFLDDPRMAPRWPQEAPISPKTPTRSLKMASGWPQDDPKMAPRGPKVAPRGPKVAPRGPKRPKDGPKMAPDRPWRLSGEDIFCATLSRIRHLRANLSLRIVRCCKMVSRWPQDGFKMASRWPQEAPRGPKTTTRGLNMAAG